MGLECACFLIVRWFPVSNVAKKRRKDGVTRSGFSRVNGQLIGVIGVEFAPDLVQTRVTEGAERVTV